MSQPSPDRIEAIRRAADSWKKDLVDTGGRNRLRRYRDLRTSTLDLTPGGAEGLSLAALDQLLSGKRVSLRLLFSEPPAFSEVAAEDDSPPPFEEALRRLRAIHKTARTNREEKGIETCFAAIGLATWKVEQGAPPNAPVILLPLEIEATGAASRDFAIEVAGDAHLNPVLTHILRSEHGIDPEDDEADVAEAPPTDFQGFHALLVRLQGSWRSLPELAIEHRAVAAIFSYATMPLVADLERNAELFSENDIVAAIAGDGSARESLASRICDPAPEQPDLDPPSNEFLILDADSSQHMAINQALGGESLVIQGPPGTGKSQTISNLIAAFIAEGKRVLFVAEKRAAIEAVTKRLEQVGLSDLLMDLHGRIVSRRDFARTLADSLGHVSTIPALDHTDLHTRLQDRREALRANAAALHERREPWGLSVFEMQKRLLAAPAEARTDLLLTREDANSLDADGFRELKELIEDWIDLNGHRLAQEHPEWARAALDTPEAARDAFDLVRDLEGERLPAARRTLFGALAEVGIAFPGTIAERQEVVDLLLAIERTLERCRPQIYGLDRAGLGEALAPSGGFLAKLRARLSGASKRARETVGATLRQPARLSNGEALELLEQTAEQTAEWVRREGGGEPRAPREIREAAARLADLQDGLDSLEQLGIGGLRTSSDAALAEQLRRMASNRAVAIAIPHIREIEARFGPAGIQPLMERVGGDIPPEAAAATVEYAWLNRVLEDLDFADPRLSAFESERHSRYRDEFAEADRLHLATTAQRVHRLCAEAVIAAMNEHPEEATLVRREAAKKSRHLSVRQLFARAPHVLSALRPCWTMSPVLAAEMIPADRELFDVVIFDEASQIPPAEAIGSLARAPQAVIAGDSRQLPPTSFFGKGGGDDGDEPDDDDPAALTSDIESLLDAAGVLLRDRMLQWHYRSRDARLIAFSNNYIYGGALTAFPSAIVESPLSHCLIPFRPIIDGSGTRSNPDEVAKVVDLVLEHARETPEETLGVIAFGQHHADNIENALMRRLGNENDSSLDAFFSETNEERFFVKNIERVQGDERDAIILSVGYHKNADGKLPYRFGPILQDGGERRLNVAVTRARSRLTLVSSFSHHDMDPGRSSAKGVELLRQYLEYAASKGASLGATVVEVPLNPFELAIKEGLERRGIPVTPQYGVAGYRIDFACAHPEERGRMVLAVEADGAAYHSSPTARDRDRLRQQVLEAKGWRFHRIWSTAWFRDREAELDKAEEAWKRAVAEADGEAIERPRPSPPPPPIPSAPAPQRGPRPDVPRRGADGYDAITDYRPGQLRDLARWIESDSLLRTEDDLLRAMMDELGFRRSGKRITDALTRAIREARG